MTLGNTCGSDILDWRGTASIVSGFWGPKDISGHPNELFYLHYRKDINNQNLRWLVFTRKNCTSLAI